MHRALVFSFALLIHSASAFGYACRAIFASMFREPDVYHVNRCAVNSHKVVNRLIEQGVPADKINVIYLLYEQYRGTAIPILYQGDLMPPMTRNGTLRHTWPRHVVVEVNGEIYDLDHRPEPVPARDYFKQMFPKSYYHPEGGLESHIFLRSVPAVRNREEFWFKRGDDAEVVKVLGPREDTVKGLPVESAKSWIERVGGR